MQNKITIPATPELEITIREFQIAKKAKDEATATTEKFQKKIIASMPYTHGGEAVDSCTFTSASGSVNVLLVDAAIPDKNVEVLKTAGLTQDVDYTTTAKASVDLQSMNATARDKFIKELRACCLANGLIPEIIFTHKLAERAQIQRALQDGYGNFMAALKPSTRVTIK